MSYTTVFDFHSMLLLYLYIVTEYTIHFDHLKSTVTCCINKTVINFTTQGMHLVGQDEIVILLEVDESNRLPKDIFVHLNEILLDAEKGKYNQIVNGFAGAFQQNESIIDIFIFALIQVTQ